VQSLPPAKSCLPQLAGPAVTGALGNRMRIWVKGYLGLKAAFADRPFVDIEADRSTLRDLLDQLEQPADNDSAAPGTGRRLVILHNGRHISHLPDGLDTVLRDGDQVSIFPPVVGG
jgi:molybdopterin converting factor small subunit